MYMMMNFARLKEIFCKQVVSETGKLHIHQQIFLMEFPVVNVLDTTIFSHCHHHYLQHFHIKNVRRQFSLIYFLQDYYTQDFHP